MPINVRKLFSFTDWAAHRPTEQLPAERLDAELAALRKGILELSKQLDDIRRDDGKLKPELISAALLPKDLSASLAADIRTQLSSEFQQITNASAQARAAAELASKGTSDAIRKADRALAAAKSLEALKQATFDRLSTTEKVAQQAAEDAAAERRAIEMRLQGSRASGGPGDGGAAETWADTSRAWAEFMDGNATIPMDLIAQTDVTGDHWSARWWAHRAGELGNEAIEGIFKYYIGAYDRPPTQCPNGDPLTPGVLYYDTSEQTMMVWDGDSWNPLIATVPTPADLQEFHYEAVQGQTEFGGVDIFGNEPKALLSGNANVFLNGVRLTERLNWVTIDERNIRIKRPAHAGSILTIEWFDSPQKYSTAGKVDTHLWVFDGVRTTFPIFINGELYEPLNAENMLVSIDGAMLDPGVDFQVSGSDIAFCEAPLTDARKWAICGLPIGVPDSGAAINPGFSSLLRCIYAATVYGQTVFGGMDKYGVELVGCSNTDNIISVHVNGVLIEPNGFTVLSDNQIQLTRGVALSSSVTVDVISVGDGSGTAPVDHSHDCGVFG
jgi:hypothetical protein